MKEEILNISTHHQNTPLNLKWENDRNHRGIKTHKHRISSLFIHLVVSCKNTEGQVGRTSWKGMQSIESGRNYKEDDSYLPPSIKNVNTTVVYKRYGRFTVSSIEYKGKLILMVEEWNGLLKIIILQEKVASTSWRTLISQTKPLCK